MSMKTAADQYVLKEFGHKLRKAREEAGLTIQEAADYGDISMGFLGKVERGENNPSAITVGKLAKAYNISADYLFEGIKGYKEMLDDALSKLSEEQRRFLDIGGMEPERLNYKTLLEIVENGISGKFDPIRLSSCSKKLFLHILEKNAGKD